MVTGHEVGRGEKVEAATEEKMEEKEEKEEQPVSLMA